MGRLKMIRKQTQNNSQYYDHYEPRKIIRPSDNTWGIAHLLRKRKKNKKKRDTVTLEGFHKCYILDVPFRIA